MSDPKGKGIKAGMDHTQKDFMLGSMLCCCLKFLITFEQSVQHFNFPLSGPENYVAGSWVWN